MTKLARVPDRTSGRAEAQDGPAATVHTTLYYAFLSYSHRDEAMADWLHQELERFRVPSSIAGRLTEQGTVPKRLTPIFRDRSELAASGDLGTEIREALAASRYLIVLCSPAAAQSRWTNTEIETFKRLRPEGSVFAAIVAGEPFASEMPGREAEECLPPALRVHYDRRGRPTGRRAEPLCADLRESGDGKRMGFLKLVAGMLSLGLDDLVRREAMRRQRRLSLIAAGSLAGMVVTSGLAIAAIDARDAARDQRREAEGLIGYMLGDLRAKLEPVGRLDALDGVGSRILAYYQKLDMAELSDAALMQRSRALALMGDVARLRGDSGGALQLYREAVAGTQEALRREPDDAQRLFDHAQNVFWVGEIVRQRGQTSAAEAAFRDYKRLADRMVAIQPDNLKWRMEVQYAEANLGIVLYEQRRFAEAAGQFQRALSTIEAVIAVDPSKAEYQRALLESLAWMADARLAEGHLDEAIVQREREVALLDRLIRQSHGDVSYRQEAISARQALGRLFGRQAELEAALVHLRAAVGIAQRLIPTEPDNTYWVGLGASAQLALAEHLLVAGQKEEAEIQTRSGCERADRLMARDASVASWRQLSAECLVVRSRLALAAGATAEALKSASNALKAARTGASGDPVERRYSIAGIHRLIGDIHRRAGNPAAAEQAWRTAFALLPKGVTERPWETNERAQLLRRLGRVAESRPIAAKLQRMGYRELGNI